jgi:hypothetical protein
MRRVFTEIGDRRWEMGISKFGIRNSKFGNALRVTRNARLSAALALCATLALSGAATGWGQQSITTAGSAVAVNFNSIGTSSTASLPTGWTMGTDWSTGATATTQAAGTSGTGIVSSSWKLHGPSYRLPDL